MPSCSAPGCFNNDRKGFKMSIFPRNPERKAKWEEAVFGFIRNNLSNYTYLCKIHFEDNQWENNRLDGKIKLKPNAIPTLFPDVCALTTQSNNIAIDLSLIKTQSNENEKPSNENVISDDKTIKVNALSSQHDHMYHITEEMKVAKPVEQLAESKIKHKSDHIYHIREWDLEYFKSELSNDSSESISLDSKSEISNKLPITEKLNNSRSSDHMYHMQHNKRLKEPDLNDLANKKPLNKKCFESRSRLKSGVKESTPYMQVLSVFSASDNDIIYHVQEDSTPTSITDSSAAVEDLCILPTVDKDTQVLEFSNTIKDLRAKLKASEKHSQDCEQQMKRLNNKLNVMRKKVQIFEKIAKTNYSEILQSRHKNLCVNKFFKARNNRCQFPREQKLQIVSQQTLRRRLQMVKSSIS